MDPYLTAAVGVIGGICLINLALTFGILRRLREQAELLSGGLAVASFEPNMLVAGATVGEFRATTADGGTMSNVDLIGNTLVGFLTPGCPACLESLPWFVARAESVAGGRDRVLVVVAGIGAEQAEPYARLTSVARVVTEVEHGPVARAFGVRSYPAFALLYGDTVVASDFVVDRLPLTVAAPA